MQVSYFTQYGLNWTTEMPSPGSAIVLSGSWQPYSLGQSFDLNRNGFGVASGINSYAEKESLNIGSNDYSPVHIIRKVESKLETCCTCSAIISVAADLRIYFMAVKLTSHRICSYRSHPVL